jgi:hypothetical protein
MFRNAYYYYYCTLGLTARIVEPAETVIARERPSKRHTTDDYRDDISKATIDELWEDVLSVQSAATATTHYNKASERRDVFCTVRFEANSSCHYESV